MNDQELPIDRIGDVAERPSETRWLVQSLWPAPAVSVIGGQPKCGKSFLGLELAVAVASATPFLGRFPVERPGRVLAYLAEDSPGDVKARVRALCRDRRVDLATLDLHLITAPSLRLDERHDRERLEHAIATLQPRLLLLDPLIRLHAVDENDSRAVSALLGHLRQLERTHDLSVVLVHHTRKNQHGRPGQALRGSSDLHAWLDVGAYLVWRRDRLELTFERRAGPPLQAIHLALVSQPEGSAHLVLVEAPADDGRLPLAEQILGEIRHAGTPLRRAYLRARLRVNNAKLGRALEDLERMGTLERSREGWGLRAPREGSA